MKDSTALRVVVDGERLLDMHGDACARLHVDRCERLAVEFVDPLRQVLHAGGEDATHRLLAREADRAHDVAVARDDRRAATVGLDQRGRAGAGGGNERLRAQVLLSVASSLTSYAGNAIRITDPAEASLRRARRVSVSRRRG